MCMLYLRVNNACVTKLLNALKDSCFCGSFWKKVHSRIQHVWIFSGPKCTSFFEWHGKDLATVDCCCNCQNSSSGVKNWEGKDSVEEGGIGWVHIIESLLLSVKAEVEKHAQDYDVKILIYVKAYGKLKTKCASNPKLKIKTDFPSLNYRS